MEERKRQDQDRQALALERQKIETEEQALEEDAFGDIARLQPPSSAELVNAEPAPTPHVTTRPASRPPAAADQALALERQKLETEKQALEERKRQDQDRQALALERQKLETEKRALERLRLVLDRERLQRQRAWLEQERERLQQRATLEQDRTPPVIRTATVLKTNQPHVTIGGSVSDTSGIAAVQVDGKEVPFSAADGRFSVKTSVAIGRNSIRIAAIDIHGNRAERVVSVDRKRRIPKVDFGNYHALVIGIADYKQLPKLKTAVGDAKAVAAVLLEKYGFTVSSLINPNRNDILDALDELAETLEKSDNLLVYYAGHGWQDEKSGRGYWLPVNAKASRKSRWFSNADLTDSLKVIAAKHVMVVADSCYSGTLTRSIKVPDRNSEYIARMAAKRTRVVLSSGGLEPVMDSGGGKHSVFANEFLKALNANEAVMDGTELFEQVRRRVVLNADQTPEYSDIRHAGHEGGDFLFVRKD
ncbi:MAG: caspase family protein [Alphaproteobacteria bacterium]